MRWINKLERNIGWFAIKNLTLYIVIGNAIVWLAGFVFTDNVFVSRLALSPDDVLKGEVWRLFTFIFTNSVGSMPFFLFIELYFLYMIGSNLEASWGSFRLTLYYFIGFFFTVAISMLTGYPVWGARYIHLSLFFAFAMLAPDMRILLFFFFPVKIKWLAWFSGAFLAYEFVMAGSWVSRAFILAPMAAFLLFFGRDITEGLRQNRKAVISRREFDRRKNEGKIVKLWFHKCEVCGRTEVDAPKLDFRYCSKCEGDHEYCSDHISDHEHR